MRRLAIALLLLGCQDLGARHRAIAPAATVPAATAPTTTVASAAPPPASTTELALESAPPATKVHDILRIEPRKHFLSGTESLLPMKKSFVGKRIVFLNRRGGTYTPGSGDSVKNTTTIFAKTTTIPPYEKGDAAWSTVLACTKAQLTRWNLEVTDVDPGAKPHIEIVVGGDPSLGGLASTVGGIAPMLDDCGVNDGAIGFVFSRVFSKDDLQAECEVVAHELGHTLGLDHEYHCPDNMTYLEGCGAKRFVDQAAQCGESKARACTCGPTQNSSAVLDKNVGLAEAAPPVTPPAPPPPPPVTKKGDGKPPTITLVAPANGTQLPGGADVVLVARVEDKDGVGKVLARWRVGDDVSEIDCAAPPAGISCNNLMGNYVFRLPAGQGSRRWSIRAVDAAGNAATSAERTLTLEGEGPTPPPALPPGFTLPPLGTATPPPVASLEASFVAPDDGTMVHFGETIAVQVSVKGPADSVQVVWRGTFGDELQPLTKGANGVWTGNLTVPKLAFPGPRRVRAIAKSATGASVEAKARTIAIIP